MDAILAMPFVDDERVVMGGQSRGGILSVAYAGRRPEQVKGVINFVGGWSAPNPWGGHGLFAYPDVWAPAVDAYLKRRGLP